MQYINMENIENSVYNFEKSKNLYNFLLFLKLENLKKCDAYPIAKAQRSPPKDKSKCIYLECGVVALNSGSNS